MFLFLIAIINQLIELIFTTPEKNRGNKLKYTVTDELNQVAVIALCSVSKFNFFLSNFQQTVIR